MYHLCSVTEFSIKISFLRAVKTNITKDARNWNCSLLYIVLQSDSPGTERGQDKSYLYEVRDTRFVLFSVGSKICLIYPIFVICVTRIKKNARKPPLLKRTLQILIRSCCMYKLQRVPKSSYVIQYDCFKRGHLDKVSQGFWKGSHLSNLFRFSHFVPLYI